MIEITYYSKLGIKNQTKYTVPALQFAGYIKCPSCGNDHAIVINDTDEVKDWSIECGECDFQFYGVKVIDCGPMADEGYYELFPDECPCSLCSNESPDDEYCWRAGYYVADVIETYPSRPVSVQQLMDKLMSGTILTTDELIILQDSVNQGEE